MIDNSVITKDQDKFLVAKLLERSYLKLTMDAVCENLLMKQGAGLTAYMVRYKRMNVKVDTLTEGETPAQSTFELEQVTVELDQYGDYVMLTDVSLLTAKHPLMQQAQLLLADNAARVMDREITIVLLAGTNVQYFDGSIASRSEIKASNIISHDVTAKANITLVMGGASPIGGMRVDAKKNSQPNYNASMEYMAICGPYVKQDIMRPSSNFGSFIQNNVYNQKGSGVQLGALGKWLGFLWIETNFIPIFTLFGNKTAAAAAGAAAGGCTGVTVATLNGAGTLTASTAYYWKVVRRSKIRGFPENISMIHTTSTGVGEDTFTFAFDSNYYYDLYFGSAGTSDADLKLVGMGYTNETVTVLEVPTSTVTAPANIRVANDDDPSAVHIVFMSGESAVAWCGFYDTQFYVSPAGATNTDPLSQRRTVGWKFFGKAVIKNNDFFMRVEVASSFAAAFA